MKAALVAPFLHHLPIHPGSYMGYGAAVMEQRFDLDVIDLNAVVYATCGEKRDETLADVDRAQVVFDHFHLQPLYDHLQEQADDVYGAVAWENFASVTITSPSWFVTVPTEAVLRLAEAIRCKAPTIPITFFGNSIGSWTDSAVLRDCRIRVCHLNDMVDDAPGNQFDDATLNRPVDFDRLPVPVYTRRGRYLFNFLPFRLKHGCSWGRCRFCSLVRGWNSGYLERRPGSVLREIEALQERYNPALFICRDNSINGNNLIEFCSRFAAIEKPWIAASRADLTEKEIDLLRASACRAVYFGLESGSDRLLQKLGKGLQARQMSLFIKRLNAVGILPAPSLFVGAPEETEADFAMTLRFVREHRRYLEIVNLYPFRLTPGSSYAREGKLPSQQTGARLSKLTRVCREAGLTVCVGEQGAEYRLATKICPQATEIN